MKTNRLALYLAAVLLTTGWAHAAWQLTWSDEFNGTSVNTNNWAFETGNSGWGNNELQYYRSQNAEVLNGHLKIVAKHENFGTAHYTSARLKTQGKASWEYGKVEARIAMPAFQGVWPAFWMLGNNLPSVGWPTCGEIDIMEHINTGGNMHGSCHWTGANGAQADFTNSTNTSVTDYHTYSVEWSSTAIRWFVDGVQYSVIDVTNGVNGTYAFHKPFFIILNLAIGGNWPGSTVDTGALPAAMYVDYVRVYKWQ